LRRAPERAWPDRVVHAPPSVALVFSGVPVPAFVC
jgi:hypothetical protein